MNNTMDRQIIMNNSLLRQNNQLLAKLEEKKDIIQRRNTELQIHKKEVLTILQILRKKGLDPLKNFCHKIIFKAF